MNYFSRQLGIVSYNSAIPVAFTQQDALDMAADSTPRDEDVDPLDLPASGDARDGRDDRDDRDGRAGRDGGESREREKEREKVVYMGFAPPREDGIPNGMRPRKSKKSKRAMLQAFGEF